MVSFDIKPKYLLAAMSTLFTILLALLIGKLFGYGTGYEYMSDEDDDQLEEIIEENDLDVLEPEDNKTEKPGNLAMAIGKLNGRVNAHEESHAAGRRRRAALRNNEIENFSCGGNTEKSESVQPYEVGGDNFSSIN